jgi:hypothetical protein
MRFQERFSPYVCEGDSIACEIEGFRITARIFREFRGIANAPVERLPEGRPEAPDRYQNGCWPSLDMKDPGFIGEADQGSVQWTDPPPNGNNVRERLARAQAEAEAIMAAWRRDDWFYCGIVLAIACETVELSTHAASLWGVEANYPGSDNACLSEVADALLADALEAGRQVLARLMMSEPARAVRG